MPVAHVRPESVRHILASAGAADTATGTGEPVKPAATGDLPALIAQAGQAFADYQRLTAEGELSEAGGKLAELKRVLGEMQARSK